MGHVELNILVGVADDEGPQTERDSTFLQEYSKKTVGLIRLRFSTLL